MTKSNPIVWGEIYVQDMERAKSFYESVFILGKIIKPDGVEFTSEGIEAVVEIDDISRLNKVCCWWRFCSLISC